MPSCAIFWTLFDRSRLGFTLLAISYVSFVNKHTLSHSAVGYSDICGVETCRARCGGYMGGVAVSLFPGLGRGYFG